MLYKENGNNPQKITIDYRAVLNRLQNSIAIYSTEFPEVAALKREVALIYFNIFLIDAHLSHLKKICSLLEKKKGEAPIINLLHEGFCTDLELFKRGASINQESAIYF
jgi:hypothetical protein